MYNKKSPQFYQKNISSVCRYNIYHLDDSDEMTSIFLPPLTFQTLLDINLTSKERRNKLSDYLKKKRGMRERFLNCEKVFLPFYWMDHWYLYILFNPSNIENNYSESGKKIDAKTILVVMDSFDQTAVQNRYVVSMFCFMLISTYVMTWMQ